MRIIKCDIKICDYCIFYDIDMGKDSSDEGDCYYLRLRCNRDGCCKNFICRVCNSHLDRDDILHKIFGEER